MALLSIEGVRKEYQVRGKKVLALDSVDLTIAEGEFVTIVGPSGCGKSTLLNLIVGLLRSSMGRVVFRGAPIDGICTKIGYVTQKDNLLPWRTLVANVEIAPVLACSGRNDVQHVNVARRNREVINGHCGVGRRADRLEPHLRVAGSAGPEGLIPTTDRFGTALADIVRCSACGHMQLERFPSEVALGEAYAEAESLDYAEEEIGQRATAGVALESIERFAPGIGGLVDLGAMARRPRA